MTSHALRLRPVPVVEPHPALRVVPDAGEGAAPPAQTMLLLDPWPRAGRPEPSPRPSADPASHGFALRFAQAALEVAAGLRPPGQLQRWTTEGVQATLQHRHASVLRSGGRPRRARVHSVHVATPVDGVAEVAAVVGDGARCRALAFRMEGRDARWRVTALHLG